jgi:hypothetical protein
MLWTEYVPFMQCSEMRGSKLQTIAENLKILSWEPVANFRYPSVFKNARDLPEGNCFSNDKVINKKKSFMLALRLRSSFG